MHNLESVDDFDPTFWQEPPEPDCFSTLVNVVRFIGAVLVVVIGIG